MSALPVGTHTGHAHGRRYIFTKTLFNKGRSVKLVAEELGGSDYISLNFYWLKTGRRLFPCEMSREKVTRFVTALVPDHPSVE
nr:hypothetical protein [uncultured Roseobacter sp.]